MDYQESMLTKLRAYLNTGVYFLRSRYHRSDVTLPVIDSGDVGPVSRPKFAEIVSDHGADEIFVHVGLSDVASAFGDESYTFLRDTLDEHFGSVMVPGFTPSFRSSGVYHKRFSNPEYGTFARLFLDDADYRTNDAIHSILVRGEYRFEECEHHTTFSEDGCWEKFDDENVLYANIGTPWIISTQLHYLEHALDVPYVEAPTHDGIIYYDEDHYESVSQQNMSYRYPIKWNRSKIEEYLRSRDVLQRYDLNGLQLRFFNAAELRKALEPKIAEDPHYLVT